MKQGWRQVAKTAGAATEERLGDLFEQLEDGEATGSMFLSFPGGYPVKYTVEKVVDESVFLKRFSSTFAARTVISYQLADADIGYLVWASFQDAAEYRMSGLTLSILDPDWWLQSAVEVRARFCVDAATTPPLVLSRSGRRTSRHGRHSSKRLSSLQLSFAFCLKAPPPGRISRLPSSA